MHTINLIVLLVIINRTDAKLNINANAGGFADKFIDKLVDGLIDRVLLAPKSVGTGVIRKNVVPSLKLEPLRSASTSSRWYDLHGTASSGSSISAAASVGNYRGSRGTPAVQHILRRAALNLLSFGVFSAMQGIMSGKAHAELKDYVLDGLGEEGIVDIPLGLGNAKNANVFEPDRLELTQGVLYRLRLKNYGTVSHNFAAPDFIDRSFSILVRTGGGEGEDPLVEVKGPGIRVVGMKAGGRADWYLMPVRTGEYDFKCTVPGHEAMKGIITVKSSKKT